MHVITKKKIKEAQSLYKDCASALIGWYQVISKNDFNSYADLKRVFSSVDKVRHLYVFNIGGNKLRLIASIHFNRQKVYIREILTHKEYDTAHWKREIL